MGQEMLDFVKADLGMNYCNSGCLSGVSSPRLFSEARVNICYIGDCEVLGQLLRCCGQTIRSHIKTKLLLF